MQSIGSQFHLYANWPDDLMSVELQTYQNLDTEAWLKSTLSLLEAGEAGPLKVVVPNRDGTRSEHFFDDPKDSRRQTIRLLRYLSSEQLFLMLLSAQKQLPYARFSQTIKYSDINRYYSTIASGDVPSEFSRICGRDVDFSTWIAVKAGDWEARACCPSLPRFIRNEASFLSDRTFVNAIKHGRCQSGRADEVLGVQVEIDGVWQQLFDAKPTIWVDEWKERNVDGRSIYEHYHHAESFDVRQEIGVLQVSAILMRAIKASRVAYLEMKLQQKESCRISFQIPKEILDFGIVNRFKYLPTRASGERQ